MSYVIAILVQFFNVLVTSCDDFTCGENKICVMAGDSYQCVCHPDYNGENCTGEGRYESNIYVFTDHF